MASPLASTSRINLPTQHTTPRHRSQQQQSLRFLLAADSDSDDDCENLNPLFLGLDQAGYAPNNHHDDDEDDSSEMDSDTEMMRQAKRARKSAAIPSSAAKQPPLARIFNSPSKRVYSAAARSTRNAAAGPSTPTKARKPILVKGNVTPSKAFSIFKRAKANRASREAKSATGGLLTPPPSSPAAAPSSSFGGASISCSSPGTASLRGSQTTPRRRTRLGVEGFFSPGNDYLPPATLLSSATAPLPLAVRHLVASGHPSSTFSPSPMSVQDAMWSLKTRRSVGGWSSSSFASISYRPRLNANSFLASYASPPCSVLRLPLLDDGGLAHPLCSSYSYSSRSANPSAQYLAIGDDQGRLTLLNTLPSQDEGAEEYDGTPSWLAVDAEGQESIFELAWRFDDRVILSGGSDYVVRSWDVEYQCQVDRFEAHRGSPRSIVWDPTTSGDACGSVFASAGRDGAIHLWDARVQTRAGSSTAVDASMRLDGMDIEDESTTATPGKAAKAPVLSIWSAHTDGAVGAGRSRSSLHSGSGRPSKRALPPKGVTSLCYLPDGNGHRLVSAGCENGVLKCWDLRTWSSGSSSSTEYGSIRVEPPPASQGRKGKAGSSAVGPSSISPDLTLVASHNRRAHGISHLVASSSHIFASSTDGRIYNVPSSSFIASAAPVVPSVGRPRKGIVRPPATTAESRFGREDMDGPTPFSLVGLVTPSQVGADKEGRSGGGGGLYDAAQRQNTLYAKMALFNDRFLAVGCNTGEVCMWDVENPSPSPALRLGGGGEEEEGTEGSDDDDDAEGEEGGGRGRLEDVAREMGWGIAVPSSRPRHRSVRSGGRSLPSSDGGGRGRGKTTQAIVLRSGHGINAEINSLSWCNGPHGPTLTSVGDDAVVRSWFPHPRGGGGGGDGGGGGGGEAVQAERMRRRQEWLRQRDESDWW